MTVPASPGTHCVGKQRWTKTYFVFRGLVSLLPTITKTTKTEILMKIDRLFIPIIHVVFDRVVCTSPGLCPFLGQHLEFDKVE